MKIFQLLIIFFTVNTFLIGCGGEISSSYNDVDILTKEERLRMELDESWSFCKKQKNGSSRIVIDIDGDGITLSAHEHDDKACNSKNYQSYKVGAFDYSDFKANHRQDGSARIKLRDYYPNRKSFEDGVTVFSGRVMAEALVRINFNADFSELKLTFDQVKTVSLSDIESVHQGNKQPSQIDRQADKSRPLLKLKRATAKANMYGPIKTGSSENIYSFQNQDEAINWFYTSAGETVAKECIDEYFKKPLSMWFPDFGSINFLFKDRKSHLDLSKDGFSTRIFSVLDLEDRDKVPYIGFLFDYENVTTNSWAVSGFVCRINDRAGALSFVGAAD